MILKCQAILFDLDGVLVDSTVAVERVWRKWAREHDIDPEFVMANAHGRCSIETIRLVAPHLDAERENLNVENMEIQDKDGIAAIPGAPALLASIPRGRCLIVTSATTALASARLRYAGLDVPERLVTADDVAAGKPSPEPYLKGAEALGFAPGDCIVFEDTPAGVQSGKSAGMRVIALKTTYPAAELQAAETVLDSLVNVRVGMEEGRLVVDIQDSC